MTKAGSKLGLGGSEASGRTVAMAVWMDLRRLFLSWVCPLHLSRPAVTIMEAFVEVHANIIQSTILSYLVSLACCSPW